MYIFTASSGLLSFISLALEGPQEIMASKTRDKDECFFKLCGDDQSTKSVSEVSTRRIKSIIEASKLREDNIHISLEQELTANNKFSIMCQRDCVFTYTSKCHIKRYLKRRHKEGDVESPVPTKRCCRSNSKKFSFQEQCLFCGDLCIIRKTLVVGANLCYARLQIVVRKTLLNK